MTAQVTLPSDREIRIERSFNAPRALVFRAFTEPDLVRRWMLGPPGWSMPVCEMDLRVGGPYRVLWRSDDGKEFGFVGTFREVQPPSRLVHTEGYEAGMAGGTYPSGGESVVTMTFVEESGITTLTSVIDFGSKEARDAAVNNGMTDGTEQSYQLLDRLLQEPGI